MGVDRLTSVQAHPRDAVLGSLKDYTAFLCAIPGLDGSGYLP